MPSRVHRGMRRRAQPGWVVDAIRRGRALAIAKREGTAQQRGCALGGRDTTAPALGWRESGEVATGDAATVAPSAHDSIQVPPECSRYSLVQTQHCGGHAHTRIMTPESDGSFAVWGRSAIGAAMARRTRHVRMIRVTSVGTCARAPKADWSTPITARSFCAFSGADSTQRNPPLRHRHDPSVCRRSMRDQDDTSVLSRRPVVRNRRPRVVRERRVPHQVRGRHRDENGRACPCPARSQAHPPGRRRARLPGLARSPIPSP